MARHAAPQEQALCHPLDAILEGVHTFRDMYQATMDKAAILGHEFDTAGPQGKWASIGTGTREDLAQVGRVEGGRIIAVRSSTVMPGESTLTHYAARHGLESKEAAEEQFARLRVLAAGTYIEQDQTPDGPRVVAFGIAGYERVAPKTNQSLRALQEAGYIPTASVLGEDPLVPGQLNPSEVLLCYDAALGAPYTGEAVDTTGKQIDPSSRFGEWNASVSYWESRATAELNQGILPVLGGAALRG